MHVSRFGKRLVLAVVTTATMLTGVPASHAASSAASSAALCNVTGNRFDDVNAVYDLNCANGTADYVGAWHLNELNGNFTGTGPHGQTINMGAIASGPICITVGGTIRYCKSVRVSVCVDSNCTWVTLYICITYRIPKVTICVETANTGEFDGDAVFDGASNNVAQSSLTGPGSGTTALARAAQLGLR